MKMPCLRDLFIASAALLAAVPVTRACDSGRPEPVRNVAIASRAGTATLIGFTEYASTNEPPRVFRRQVTNGRLFTGQWSIAGCPGASEPVSYHASFPPNDPGWADSTGSATLVPVEVDSAGNRIKYRLTALDFANRTQSSPWGNLWGLRVVAVAADGAAPEIWTSVGQERWLSRIASRSPYEVFIQGYWSLAGWIGQATTRQALNVRAAVDLSVRDEWNETVEHTLPDGEIERTGANARFTGIASFPLGSGGTPEAWPEGLSPAAAYGHLVRVTAQSATSRRIEGRGECLGAAPRFERAEGVVTQDLSLEDTEDDAMARAPMLEGEDAVAYRDRRTTGLSFDFAEFSFEVPLQVACEGTYLVHFHFQRKARSGAGEPEGFSRTLEKRLAAGHQTLAPGWFDMAAMELHLPEGEVMTLDHDTEYRLMGVEIEQACPDAEPGKDQIWRDSVHVHISLGRGPGGRSAGRIALEAESITPRLYTPGALAVALPYGSGTTVVRDAAGRPRQVRAPAAFVDIVVIGEAAYEVRFHPISDAGEPDAATGLSAPSGAPYLVYRIENPNPAASDQLRVSRIKGEKIRVAEYSQDSETGAWTFATGNGLRQESVEVEDLGDGRIETIAITGRDGVVVATHEREISQFAWGEETVREVRDPAGAALVTVSTYVESPGEPGYGLLQRRDHPDGSYEEWAYDFEDRPVELLRPSADGGVRRTQYLYEELADADGDATPEQLTTTIESVGEAEVSRMHAIRWSQRARLGSDFFVRQTEIRSAAPGAAWDAAGNLVTEVLLYGAGPWNGQPRRRWSPDGTVRLIEHRQEGGGRQITVVSVGAPNEAGDAIVAGSLTTSVMDASGRTVSESVIDVASGLKLSAWQATEFDFLGRPVRLAHADGTYVAREYSCCGLAREVDRDGLATAYRYDDLGRQFEMSRDGVTLRTEHDAEGRVTARTRIGTDGSEIRLEARRYDLAGRLVEERDAMDRVTMHEEEMQPAPGIARRHTVTAPDGGTRIEEFNVDGTLAAIGGTAAAPRAYRYGVEAGGEFTQEFRPAEAGGRDGPPATEWTKRIRDFLGRPWQTLHADGAAEFLYYNERGQVVRQVDADGVTVLFAYNAQGERDTLAIDLNGNGAIDQAGPDRITQVTEEVGERDGLTVRRREVQVWARDGDEAAKTVEVAEHSTDGSRAWFTSQGLTTTVTTETDGAGGRTVTMVGPNGVRETHTFAAGRLLGVSVEAPGLGVIQGATYAYDPHHRPESIVDARNGATRLTHHADGQVHTITSPDPDPTREGAGFDPQQTVLFYDDSGRLARVRQSDGAEVHTEYWPSGQVRRSWGARTYPVEFAYDAQGRLRTLTTWQDFAADTGRAVTTWRYDARRGWLLGKAHADGAGPTYAYSPSGRLRSRTWARQPLATASYRYDAAGGLTAVDYSDQTPDVAIIYDRLGRPRQVADGVGTCQYVYDESGRLREEAYVNGALQELAVGRTYDAWSRLESVTLRQDGAAAGENLHETTYAYDAASRLEQVGVGHCTATYGYVALSSLPGTTMFREAGALRLTVTREFDRLNRLVAVTHASATAGVTAAGHAYTYDAAGQRIASRREDGTTWNYDYDRLGQVIGAVQRHAGGEAWLGRDFAFGYDDIGNRRTVTRRLPPPWATLVESYSANLLNQYEQRTGPRFIEIAGAAESDATVTVTHPADGDHIHPVQRQGAWFYAQVPAGSQTGTTFEQLRVTGVAGNAGPAGEDAVTEEMRGIVMPPADETYRHDADGNLVQDGQWVYEWDAENRLVAMQTAPEAVTAGAPETRLEYTYDARSRRVAKKVLRRQDGDWSTTAHRLFVYDGWNLLAELDALQNRAPARFCSWGMDMSGTLQGAGGVGGLLFTRDPAVEGTLAYCYDGNGNVSGLYDLTADQLAATYDYGPFGNLLAGQGPAAAANPFRFSTKYTDSETNYLYYGYRYYNPNTGRWLNRDPLGEAGGVNVFNACRNDMVDKTDFLGMYEPDGHFYAVFAVARMNGISASDSFRLAYYAQYPDQTIRYNAVNQGFRLQTANRNPGPRELELRAFKVLHSLHGGNAADAERWRRCLLAMSKDESLQDWQRGLVLHSLGDAFAHTRKQGDQYGPPTGHGRVGSKPDQPQARPGLFLGYLAALNAAFGGNASQDALTSFANVVAGDAGASYSDRMKNARSYSVSMGLSTEFDPSESYSVIEALDLDHHEVDQFVKAIEDRCGCAIKNGSAYR